MITILTPTYNRAKLLKPLYDSLCNQTSFDFEWLIVDDGSTDDTSEIVKTFKTDKFPILYYYKKNGGKHTAMNFSHPYINGDLLFIVDSDDVLTNDAIETITKDWLRFGKDKNIGVLSYTIKHKNGELISQGNVGGYYIDNDIDYRVNKNVEGDRCEIVRSDIFKSIPMPTFEGERCMGEGWLCRKIALKYNTVYIDKAIYIAEYLPGGLSKSGRLFRMNNPYGMMENCKGFMIPQVCWKVRLKEVLLFGTYGFCADIPVIDIIKRSEYNVLQAVMLPLSYCLFRYWSKKNGFQIKR